MTILQKYMTFIFDLKISDNSRTLWQNIINGIKYDWSSVRIDIEGTENIGIKELTWEETLEPGILRGTRSQKIGRTRGEHDSTGTLVMYTESWYDLLETLGDGYGEVSFNVLVEFADTDQPTSTAELRGCRITSKSNGGSQGTEPAEVSLDIDIMLIKENGKTMSGDIIE